MTFCFVGFSYFGLCKVPCREDLRSSAVYLGDFPKVRINLGLETRYLIEGSAPGMRRARARQTFPPFFWPSPNLKLLGYFLDPCITSSCCLHVACSLVVIRSEGVFVHGVDNRPCMVPIEVTLLDPTSKPPNRTN